VLLSPVFGGDDCGQQSENEDLALIHSGFNPSPLSFSLESAQGLFHPCVRFNESVHLIRSLVLIISFFFSASSAISALPLRTSLA
jgi:hypothetical protein